MVNRRALFAHGRTHGLCIGSASWSVYELFRPHHSMWWWAMLAQAIVFGLVPVWRCWDDL